MFSYALKMLIGDKAKYIGIVLGLGFASFIISQQAAIFVGLMARTCGFITDTSQVKIWVMDPKVQFIDDIKPLKDTDVFRVRSVSGVKWAVPLYKGLIRARLNNGTFQICNVIGLDAATLIGGPPTMLQGTIQALRRPDAVIVNDVGANDKLAYKNENKTIPLALGDTLELNDRRCFVAGIAKVSRTFQSQPVVYTTYERATAFAPAERKLLSFVLATPEEGQDIEKVCQEITRQTGLMALTSRQFKKLTIGYYMKSTGIPINFGVAVLLGFIIGTAIAGQTFYNFTLDNLRYFATFKAMGAPTSLLIRMVLLQAAWVGNIGWGLGVGGACLFGYLARNTELSFWMPWQLFVSTGVAMALISAIAAKIAVRKIRSVDLAIVFKSV